MAGSGSDAVEDGDEHPDASAPHSPAERRSIGRNLVDMLTSQVLTWGLATTVALIQPRFLGDVGQGQLRLAYSLWLIVDVLVGFGTSTYLTLQAASDRERGLALVRPVLKLRLAGYLVGWGAMTVYVTASGASRQLTVVVALVGLATMLTSMGAVARAALVGLENMRYPAIADVVAKLLSVGLVITVLLAGGRVVAVSAVAVIAATANAGLLLYYLRRFPRGDRSISVTIKAIMLGGVGYLVAEASLIVYQQVDTVVMSFLVESEQLGWYAAADQLFASLLFVPTILMMTLFPVFGRLKDEDPERLMRLVSRAMTTLLLFSVPIGLGTIAVGPSMASLIFGPEFDGAGPVLAVLGVVIIITTQTILIGQYAIATGHQRFWNTLMVTGIAVTIPLDMVLVPWTDRVYDNGAIGGAIAYVITESMMFVVGAHRFARSALVPATAGRALRIAVSGAAMFAVAWPLRDQFLLVPILAGAVTYVVAIVVTGSLGPEERALVQRFTRRGG